MFENLNIIKRAERLLEPFNEQLYDKVCAENSELTQVIQTFYNQCRETVDQRGVKFMVDVAKDLDALGIKIFSKNEVLDFFDGEPIFIRNYMYSLRLTAKIEGKSFDFPLEELSCLIPNAFFDSKKAPPSMVMFLPGTFCAAIVTKTGVVNFVGGYTDKETKFALIKYISCISEAMRELYCNCTIEVGPLSLYNIAMTTKLSCRKIDLFHAADGLKTKSITRMYVPEDSDLLTVVPFKIAASSIIIRFYPTGGVYCAGMKSGQELLVCVYFLASIIAEFTRVNPKYSGEKGRHEWNEFIRKERIKQENNKMRRRELKLAEYNRKKAEQLKIKALQLKPSTELLEDIDPRSSKRIKNDEEDSTVQTS